MATKQKQLKLEAEILALKTRVKALEDANQGLLDAYVAEPVEDILPHLHKIAALLGHRQSYFDSVTIS